MRKVFLGGILLCAVLTALPLGAETPASSGEVSRFRARLAGLSGEEREAALLAAATTLASEDKSYAERADALRRLALLQDVASIPVLQAVSNDPALGDEARRALQRIPSPVAEVALLNGLRKETDARLRAGLLSSLGIRRVEAVIPQALRTTADNDPALAEASLRALGAIKTGAALAALRTAKTRPEHQVLRLQLLLDTCGALLASPEAGSSRATVVAVLREVEEQEEFPRLRRAALVLQLRYGHRTAEDCLSVADPVARQAALAFLRRARDIDSGKVLLDYFQRATGPELVECLAALEERRQTEAVPLLYASLQKNSDPATQAALIGALGVLGNASDAGPLAIALECPDPPVSAAALEALLTLQGGDVGGAFSELLADEVLSPHIRRQLLDIARRRWLYAAVPGVIAMLEGADAELRGEALKTLERLAGPEHLPALRAAAQAADEPALREKLENFCRKLDAGMAR